MITLLINTSRPLARMGIARDSTLIAQREWKNTPQLGTQLLTILDQLFVECQLALPDINRVAVHSGPGHYSALRQGIVTASMLAYANNQELVAVEVDTLEDMAKQAQTATPVTVIEPHYT